MRKIEKKIIGIDLDSTLNCLDRKWLSVYNKEYNDNLTVNDMTSWGWSSIVKPECGSKIEDIIRRPGFFRDLEVQEYSQEVTEWLIREKNCELYIVTAYFQESIMDKFAWLSENFPHIPSRNIMPCNDKARFNGHYLIDDGAHNAEAFLKSNPSGVPLLIDFPSPWNHYVGDKFIRMHSWKEIQEYFEGVL